MKTRATATIITNKILKSYTMTNAQNMNYQAQHQSVTALYRSKVVDPSQIIKHKSGLYVLQNCPTSTYLSQSGRGVYEELNNGHTRTGNTEILTKADLQPFK